MPIFVLQHPTHALMSVILILSLIVPVDDACQNLQSLCKELVKTNFMIKAI